MSLDMNYILPFLCVWFCILINMSFTSLKTWIWETVVSWSLLSQSQSQSPFPLDFLFSVSCHQLLELPVLSQNIFCFPLLLKIVGFYCKIIITVSTEHSSNNDNNNVAQKPYSMVTFWIQLRRTFGDLSSQVDPGHRRKLNLRLSKV